MNWFMWGCFQLALAVILGAFGAHGLKNKVTPELLVIFETGNRYHFYHGFALLVTGILSFIKNGTQINTAGILFTIGILIFSGSLYLLTLTGVRWLGAITPIGGLSFIVGWIFLAIAAR
ncbi:MAG: DUF423 domain-containing protein [Elusimicrobiota bacterium]